MILEWVRATAGLILILFVPGYSLTWAFYPRKGDMPDMERFALSFALSIACVMLSALFIDVGLGLDITPPSMIATTVAFILLSLLVWKIHLYVIDSKLKQVILKRTFEYRNRLIRMIKLGRHV